MNKTELRIKYIEKRRKLTQQEKEILANSISTILFANFKLTKKIISLFLPIEKKNEINTFPIWEKAVLQKCSITVPVSNFENMELKHIKLTTKDQLTINKHGIPEPNKGEEISSKSIDYVIVPLLTFDAKGNRIGYGKGFYDRFLNECTEKCIFIGLTFFEDTEEIEDINEHDIRLDYCITPTQLIQFK